MVRVRAGLAVVATVAATLSAPLVLAPPALATSGIPLAGVADVVAVPLAAPTHLVIAGSPPNVTADGRFGAVVTGLDGSDPVTVPGLTHVTSLAVGPDAGTVWAASYDGSIAKIVPDAPTAPTIVSTGEDFGCPYDLAVASDGLVWFSYGCTADDVGIAVLDPVSGDVTAATPEDLAGGLHFPVQLDNAADAPDQMVAAEIGGQAQLFTVSGAEATAGATLPVSDVEAVRLAPDGAAVLVSGDFIYGVDEYTTDASPSLTDQYYTGYPATLGLAISPDGNLVAAVNGARTTVVARTDSTIRRTYTPSYPDQPALRGGVWTGHTLISATRNVSTGAPTVRAHPDAAARITVTQVSGPTEGTVGKTITLRGTVKADGHPVAGRTLTVTRKDGAGTVTVAHPVTGNSGGFTVPVATPNGKYVTWTVSNPADNSYQASSATHTAYVERLATFLSLAASADEYYYNQQATVTAHLGSTYTNRTVAIYAQAADGAKHRIAYGRVNGSGLLSATIRVTRNTTFSATFFGDLRHDAVTKSLLRKTHAQVTAELKNYYGTDDEGYRLYHKSKYAKLVGHVDPKKGGQCAYFGLQQYVDGKWKDLYYTDCFYLNAYSNSQVYWVLPNFAVVGRKYRTGMYWGGDRVNEDWGSLYRYFKVTA